MKTGLFENEIMRGWVKIRKHPHNIFKIQTWYTPSNQNMKVVKKYSENCLLLSFLTSLFVQVNFHFFLVISIFADVVFL